MIRIRCVVERITYQNPENGYSVLKVAVKGYDDLVTVIGNLADAVVGSVLLVEGEWKIDKKYGSQFAAEKWEETVPATVFGLEKYLGSGLIKGIGPVFAKKIVSMFGMETIEIIEHNRERLLDVPGIGIRRVNRIAESWEKQKEIKNIMLCLQSYSVSTAFAAKIYKVYADKSIETVKENPYRLADDIWGIGFKTADGIAQKLGFGHDDYVRCRSGVMYTLNELADEGHVYAGREQLAKKGVELLESAPEAVDAAITKMLEDGDLILDGEAIYLPPFYYAEIGTANKLRTLFSSPSRQEIFPKVNFEKLTRLTGVEYDEIQQSAIQKSVDSKVMVLTGGPGTGKTTTTLGIIKVLSAMRLEILLAAPTGRAAKRMTEATGMEAKTLHRLLEFKPPEGYQKNEEEPLEGDVLIVDESSMIDIILMNSLLKAIPQHMKLILVGDIDQLPSVGAGNVLRDIIDADCFPVVRLTKIFRQAQSSKIIMNAHKINEGKLPDISNSKGTDFFYIEEENPETAAGKIVDLVKNRLPGFCGVPSAQIQVLTPMQRGIVGASNLNTLLQEALNPGTECLYRSGRSFRLRDKVMQVRNNYDKEVFNGDIGVVTSLDTVERELTVSFDDRIVAYDVSELDELVPAYAITIHKSQGSEYPIVVMPILMTHFVMLQRNLIYTGITRAKKMLVLIGTKKAIAYAVRNVTVTDRNTRLKERLNGRYAGGDEDLPAEPFDNQGQL
ncbi:MAG: ATP-dependent RecD-like DNA helicase, partial [Clostridia bacterium]|nr:ATP-dependent RecD-like DNA helicase [Clostridia bacterium]